MIERRSTRGIVVGEVPVGAAAPVSVQSMTNTDTHDVEATLKQISELEHAGCEIVRVGVPDSEAAEALRQIVAGTGLPVIADLHFDWRLAFLVMEHDIAGIRINPGTIAKKERLEEIAGEAARRGIAVRVGINSGSLEQRLAGPERRAEASALATSALEGADLISAQGVTNLKISVKASDVPRTIEAYRLVSEQSDWPLHVGVTEAGTLWPVVGDHKERCRHRRFVGRGHRGHHSGVFNRRAGRGGPCGKKNPCRTGPAVRWSRRDIMSDLRQMRVRRHRDGVAGGEGARGLPNTAHGCRDGVHCERPG